MDMMFSILKVGFISIIFMLALLIFWFSASYLLRRRRYARGGDELIKLRETRVPERRQYPRAELRWPVTLETSQGPIKAETKNISVGGAFVCCENPLATGKRFPLSIEIPNQEPLDVTAEVVWSNENVPDDKVVTRGMGIRFIQISAEDRQLVNIAVQAHLETGKENEKAA